MDKDFFHWKTRFFIASDHEAPLLLRIASFHHYHLDSVEVCFSKDRPLNRAALRFAVIETRHPGTHSTSNFVIDRAPSIGELIGQNLFTALPSK